MISPRRLTKIGSAPRPRNRGYRNQAARPKSRKSIAKAVAKDLSPVAPILNGVMKEITKGSTAPELDVGEVEQNVTETVREAVSTAIEQAIEPVIEPRTVSRE